MEDKKLTLIQHLAELRKRLFVILLIAIVSSFISYFYVDRLITEVLKLAQRMNLVYLTPPELFIACIKISLVTGLIVSSPLIFYQIWLFIKPGLMLEEKKYILISLYAGVFFFILGITFAYKVILPVTINFFIGFEVEGIKPMISFGNYIGFISSILFSFGLVFEMPMIVVTLTKFKLISPEILKKNRKMVVLVIFVVAAILTPPDIISQVLLAMPMLLLFELSIFLSSLIKKREKNNLKVPSDVK